MKQLGSRAVVQLAMLERAARLLNGLEHDFVFLGGCSSALFITDPASPDVRSTMDVDCIVDVLSINDYYKIEKQLEKRGFHRSLKDDVICRWHYDDLIIDVMPTDENILGFSNRWYKDAIKYSITHQLRDDLVIHSVTAPYFIGTKIEAFRTRGNNDYLLSHDFEDIIFVVDGRMELIQEIKESKEDLKNYIVDAFAKMLEADSFQLALPGHLDYGPVTRDRTRLVLQRMQRICIG